MSSRHLVRVDSYKRKRRISTHAIERVRERMSTFDDLCREVKDLGNLLDQVVDDAIADGERSYSVLYKGEDHVIVNLAPRLSGAVAVVTKNKDQSSALTQSVVTVLTEEMARKSLESGSWVYVSDCDLARRRSVAAREDVRISTKLPLSSATISAMGCAKPDPVVSQPTALVMPMAASVSPSHEASYVLSHGEAGSLRFEVVTASQLTIRLQALFVVGHKPKAYREVALRCTVELDAA